MKSGYTLETVKELMRFNNNSWTITALKLNKPCQDCQKMYNPWQMDFDHRPGTQKRWNVSAMRSLGKKLILSEVAKCDLVCANCHRQRTWLRKNKNG